MERYLTVPEVAEQLRVGEETVRRWLRAGRLEGVLLSRKAGWRVPQESVTKMLTGFEMVGKAVA